MALDILGPANAANSVTARPSDTRTFTADDSFFRDCTSPTANDGTKLQAGFLNSVIANLRALVRGNGLTASAAQIVPDNNANDSMLLNSVQHLVQRGQMRCGIAAGVNDIAVTLSPALAEYKQGIEIIVKIASAPTGAMTINVNALGAKALLRRNGNPMQANDLLPGASYAMIYDGTAFRLATFAEGEVRRNVQNPTLWVRTDGNDANDGSANDAAHAFATIGAAMDAAAEKFDLVGRTLTIRLGNPGTYAQFKTSVPQVLVIGNTAAPASYNIQGPLPVVCVASSLTLQNLTCTNANAGGYTVQAQYNGAITLNNVVIAGTTIAGHLQAFFGGSITVAGSLTLSGTADAAFGAAGGSITTQVGSSVSVSGAYSGGFARAIVGGVIQFSSIPTGAATGPKFTVQSNGVVDSQAAGLNALPGSTAGTTATGGQYV